MLVKRAACVLRDVTPYEYESMVKTAASKIGLGNNPKVKDIVESEIQKHKTALFFRAKAIVADETNSNGDMFPVDELLKSYGSFVGVPFYTNHQNQDIEKARGKIIYAEWNPSDKAVYVIGYIDREAYPHICRGVEQDYMTGVSMGAISGASLILMADGTERPIPDVKEGDIVRTALGNNKKVSKTHCEYLGKPMHSFNLVTYHKSPLFTEDHPIWIVEKSAVEACKHKMALSAHMSWHYASTGRPAMASGKMSSDWRLETYDPKFQEASKVCEGDYFLIPSRFHFNDGCSANSDFYYLLGVYLGDGYLLKDKNDSYSGVAFCLGSDEMELAAKIRDLVNKYSKASSSEMVCEERHGLYIRVYDKSLAKWIGENIGSGAKLKRVKFNLKFNGDAQQLLAGYLDTDGCIVDKTNQRIKGNKFGGFQVSSANVGLLEDMQSLLIGLGHVSRISRMDRTPSEKSVVRIDTTEYTLAMGSNSASEFGNSIKYAKLDGKSAEIKAGKSFVTTIDGHKYMMCPVKKIVVTDGFDEPVYDLTVEDDECYVADGVSVHNCAVEYSECSICHNRAENPDSYCSHIKMMKGRKFTGTVKDIKTGETRHLKGEPVYEINFGIRFIELSGVGDPACKSCHIQGVFDNNDVLRKAASVSNNIFMYRESGMGKTASQEEVTQLEQALVTLEQISVNLIKNRKQVEVAFASDLVKILSELQEFTDELVGAGYAQAPAAPAGAPGMDPMAPAGDALLGALPGAMPTAMPISETAPLSPGAGMAPAPIPTLPGPAAATGVPGISGVRRPNMPTPPAKSIAESALDRIEKIGNRIRYLREKMAGTENEGGDQDMKRRTPSVAATERDDVKRSLATSMKEKGVVFGNSDSQETSAQDVSEKNGGMVMDIMHKAERQDAPEVTTQKQLDGGIKYHPRTGDEADQTTQGQLESLRTGEPSVVTEKQLESEGMREGAAQERITQKQLDPCRKNEEKDTVTQDQLSAQRKDDEKNVATEKQLDIWSRKAFSRANILTASDHLSAVVSSLAKSAVESCATPSQVRDVVCDMVSDTQAKTATLDSITQGGVKPSGEVNVVARAKYWGARGITIASSTKADIRKSVSDSLNILVASNEKIHPEMVLSVLEVVAEEKSSLEKISTAVDAMLVDKPDTSEQLVSSKDEIRKALSQKPTMKQVSQEPTLRGVAQRNEERKQVLAAVSKPDRIVVASFEELGITVKEAKANPKKFKQAIHKLASVAAISEKRVLAAVTNVEISPDGSVNIAIDTKDGKQEIDIPLEGETPDTLAPEGDVTGEGLDELMATPAAGAPMPGAPMAGAPAPAGVAPIVPPPEAPLPTAASKVQMTKAAQGAFGGGGPSAGGGPGMSGGMGDPAAPGIGEKPAMGDAVQSFTETSAPKDEAPGVGEQMMPGSICPFCHSTDTTTGKKGMESGSFECNECGGRYQVHVNIEVLNPETMEFSEEKDKDGVKDPTLPDMPVAAYTKLDKDSIVKIAAAEKKFGHVCPACGMVECKAIEQTAGHTAYVCPSCQTKIEKDVLVSKDDASDAYVRVSWTLNPSKFKTANCPSCKEKARKLAARMKVAKMVKSAADLQQDPKTAFPMANCIERVSRMYGANAIAPYGDCKGKVLSDCVCKQLETFGMRKKIHLVRLAEVYSQPDPMDECLKIHMDKGFKRAQAETMCKAMRKECSTDADNNSLLMAFADTKEFTKEELEVMNDNWKNRLSVKAQSLDDLEGDIGEPLDMVPGEMPSAPDAEETVVIELPAEVAKDIAGQVDQATGAPAEAEVVDGSPEVGSAGELEIAEPPAEAVDLEIDVTSGAILGMKVVKMAATPKQVEQIEGNVEAGVPRAKATIGKESPLTAKKPEIPRSDATMGDESKFDAKLPDIAVDNSTMGGESETMKGTPAINNEIKGTVIAEKKPELMKAAKTPTQVDNIEKDVEAGVPRAKATIGKENPPADKKLDIPRGNATMGGEEKFQEKLPDVPVDNATMGGESETMKGTPAVNSEIKGTVIADMREKQLEKLATGRHKKACLVAAKLAAEGRIVTADMDEIVEVLSKLELDKMEAFANKMFKMPVKVAEKTASTLSIGIVQEASVYSPDQPKSLVNELSAGFTVGSKKLNDSLTEDGTR